MKYLIGGKKASVFMGAFLIALVLGVLLLAYFQSQAGPEGGTSDGLGNPGTYTELFKHFSFHSLIDSVTTAARDSAAEGATPDNMYWMAYGVKNVPSVSKAREYLGNEGQPLCEAYLRGMQGQSYGNVLFEKTAEIGSLTVLVNEPGLSQGLYDELFQVSAEGISDTILSDSVTGEKAITQAQFRVSVSQWRFWYLFRKMRDWAEEGELLTQACSLMPRVSITGNEPSCRYPAVDDTTVKLLMDSSVRKLEASFDDNVKCEYTLDCTDTYTKAIAYGPQDCPTITGYGGVACPGTCQYSGCIYTTQYSDCLSGACNTQACKTPAMPCLSGNVSYTGGEWDPQKGREIGMSGCYGIGENHHLDFISTVTCTDGKYLKPVGNAGFEPLTFSIRLHAYLVHDEPAPINNCDYSSCPGPPLPGPPAPEGPPQEQVQPNRGTDFIP